MFVRHRPTAAIQKIRELQSFDFAIDRKAVIGIAQERRANESEIASGLFAI